MSDSLPDKVMSALRESLPHSKSSLQSPSAADLSAREERLQQSRSIDPRHPRTDTPLTLTTQDQVRLDASRPMWAAEWHGAKMIQMAQRASPCVTDPSDAVVRVTSTTICGSDLHMYVNAVPGASPMKPGDILGHECMGIVEDVGPNVRNIKKGDRVVVAAVISCGQCGYCKNGQPSLCDTTNPSGQMEYLYGHRTAGILGYSHLTGGYSGGQAEAVRVPFADVNLLPVPSTLSDQQVLLLSDVCCTGFHGVQLAHVREGDVVCVFGAGPVGLMAGYLSKVLAKASRVLIVDCIPTRLELARRLGLEPVDFSECGDLTKELLQRVPGGIDRTIECVGFRFPQSWLHKFMRAVKLESDSPEIIRTMTFVTKKGGNMALIGDYFADCNHFPIGQLMEKNITLRGGQVFVQQYWGHLLQQIENGAIDLRPWITHVAPLNEMEHAYKLFDEKEDGVIKIQLLSDLGRQRPENRDVQVQSIKELVK